MEITKNMEVEIADHFYEVDDDPSLEIRIDESYAYLNRGEVVKLKNHLEKLLKQI